MARKKTSLLEDIVRAASKLPWWGSLSLALVSYLLMHAIASRPVTPLAGPGQLGNIFATGVITTFTMIGQYILPFAFGLGALLSILSTVRQKNMYNFVELRPGTDALNEISWQDFERLVSEYYLRNGFKVTRTGGNGPDGGIDLVLRRKNETYLVQCKQWKAYKVGVQPVREFYGVMASRGAAGGYFITSGEYTEEAKMFVRGLNLELVDGRKLRNMIDFASMAATDSTEASMPAADIPVCPKCGFEMQKRVARRGANTGKEFLGCLKYPNCRGIRNNQ